MQSFISDRLPKERGFKYFSDFIPLVIRGKVEKSYIGFSAYLSLNLLHTYIIGGEQSTVFLKTRTVVEFRCRSDDRNQLLFKILSVAVADFLQAKHFFFLPHLRRDQTVLLFQFFENTGAGIEIITIVNLLSPFIDS